MSGFDIKYPSRHAENFITPPIFLDSFYVQNSTQYWRIK